MMEMIGDDGLASLVDMYMPDGLFARLVKARQGFQRGTAIGLSLASDV